MSGEIRSNMTLKQRRVKVLEKVLDDTINNEIALQIGIATKKIMMLRMGDHPMVKQVEQALRQEEQELSMIPTVIQLLQDKLTEAIEDERIEATKK